MQRVKNFKCPTCSKIYQSLKPWANHIEKSHPTLIPEGWTSTRYFYYLQTGKATGRCVICKSPTDWNESTGKYHRFCKNPKCREIYREEFKSRMINRYGKVTLLDDPEQQRKMLMAKKNSGYYELPGGKVGYASTYEYHFLRICDKYLHLTAADIMGPSPHTYYYDYKNPNDVEHEGKKFYIPDFYIPSINLEIEIKQNTSTHPQILLIDKVKEKLKDEMMIALPDINYIKITDKDYTKFFDMIIALKESFPIRREEIDPSIAEESTFAKYDKEIKDRDDGIIMLSSLISKPLDKTHHPKDDHFKHLRFYDACHGEAFYKKDILVGFYMTEATDNGVWLQGLEVLPNFRNRKLGQQILSRAVDLWNVELTSVNKQNEVSYTMLRRFGFKVWKETESMYFLRYTNKKK